MRPLTNIRRRRSRASLACLWGALVTLALSMPGAAWAGKLSWLDDVVQEVVQEARVGGRAAVR